MLLGRRRRAGAEGARGGLHVCVTAGCSPIAIRPDPISFRIRLLRADHTLSSQACADAQRRGAGRARRCRCRVCRGDGPRGKGLHDVVDAGATIPASSAPAPSTQAPAMSMAAAPASPAPVVAMPMSSKPGSPAQVPPKRVAAAPVSSAPVASGPASLTSVQAAAIELGAGALRAGSARLAGRGSGRSRRPRCCTAGGCRRPVGPGARGGGWRAGQRPQAEEDRPRTATRPDRSSGAGRARVAQRLCRQPSVPRFFRSIFGFGQH